MHRWNSSLRNHPFEPEVDLQAVWAAAELVARPNGRLVLPNRIAIGAVAAAGTAVGAAATVVVVIVAVIAVAGVVAAVEVVAVAAFAALAPVASVVAIRLLQERKGSFESLLQHMHPFAE